MGVTVKRKRAAEAALMLAARRLRAWVLDHAAEVDRLGSEHVPRLDLETVDGEALALFGEQAFFAFEIRVLDGVDHARRGHEVPLVAGQRSEGHTSELQSLMRTSYAV